MRVETHDVEDREDATERYQRRERERLEREHVDKHLKRERLTMIKDRVIERNSNTASPAFLNHIWQ